MKWTVHQRFPTAAMVLLAAWAAACGGGGGGSGDSLPPRLIGAAFAGAGGSPTAGDTLLLSFSENVSATAGLGVGDADLALSAGGTLGGATTVQDQPTARSVRLLLGSGVVFTPGATTIDFTATNDAITDAAGNLGAASTAVTIATSDGAAPTIGNLTIADVDGILNGTGPASGTLQAPQNGWTIDLTYADSGSPTALGVDPARTQVQASVAAVAATGIQPAGTNLLPLLTPVTSNSTTGSYLVPSTMTFGQGPVTLTATVLDAGGLQSAPATFSFTVRAWNDSLRPFETTTNSQQVWFLDTARDIESFTTSAIAGGASVDSVAVANGRSDYLDILYVLGLQSTAPIANVSGSLDSNQVTLQRLQAAILQDLATYYSATKVTFTFTQPSGSFGSNSSVGYASLGYSQICLAGSDDSSSLNILGVAQLDPNNQRQNNDCLLESTSSSRLGVFLHTMADSGLGPPSVSTFRLSFNAIAAAVGGTPVGEVTGDGSRLLGTTTDTRSGRIDNAIAGLARFIAVVVAHECGHSMGLVVNGPMPTGLYGGDATNFPGSSDGHIRTQSLFGSGGTNIMSPQLSYELSIDPNTAFNSLNLAYLREQVFYGN